MRGRKLIIDWQEDEATFFQLYRREPEAELRTRWHALWLLRQGYPPQHTADFAWAQQQFGVTYMYWGMRSLLQRLQISRKVPRPLAE